MLRSLLLALLVAFPLVSSIERRKVASSAGPVTPTLVNKPAPVTGNNWMPGDGKPPLYANHVDLKCCVEKEGGKMPKKEGFCHTECPAGMYEVSWHPGPGTASNPKNDCQAPKIKASRCHIVPLTENPGVLPTTTTKNPFYTN